MNKWKKRHSTHLRRQPCWVWQTLTHRNRNLKNRSRPEKFSFYFWLLFNLPGRVIRRNTINLTSHTIPIETMMLKKSHRLLKIVIDTLKKICECEGVREGSSGWLHVLMSRGLRTQVHRSIPVCLVVKYSTVHILVPLFSSKQREQQDNKNKSIYWNTRCCVRFYLVYLINHRNTVQKHLKFLSLGSQWNHHDAKVLTSHITTDPIHLWHDFSGYFITPK